jgi:asparagine synthase (glutamine-hydrolysing)
MQLARENGVTVMLDGHGADELAAGYHESFDPYLAEISAHDPAAAAQARREIIERTGHEPVGVNQLSLARPGAMHRTMLVAKDAARRRLSRTWLADGRPDGGTFLTRQFMWEHSRDRTIQQPEPPGTLNESLKLSLTQGRLANYLRYADRNSMAHSREVRQPFLSHILVEFMFSLPAHFKINSGWTKYLIRQAMAGVVPQSVLQRTDKIGFNVPQSRWMNSPALKHMATEAKAFLVNEGIVSSKWMDRGEKNWEMLMTYHLFARIERNR